MYYPPIESMLAFTWRMAMAFFKCSFYKTTAFDTVLVFFWLCTFVKITLKSGYTVLHSLGL